MTTIEIPENVIDAIANAVVKKLQKPKIGHWIFRNDDIAIPTGHYQCSECGLRRLYKDNFCPNCGTNMIGLVKNAESEVNENGDSN